MYERDKCILKLLISSMMKAFDRVPLTRVQMIQHHSVQASPFKCGIKISNQKFPADFFRNQHQIQKPKLGSRGPPQTQEQNRIHLRQQLSSFRKRQMSTALDHRSPEDNDEELILGVISTARQMRRMIRKHSIQLKGSKRVKKPDLAVELPPLVMKRGNTTAF